MSDNISKLNAKLLDELAERIENQIEDSVVKIGIDGFCASGKTTIANELTNRIQERGRSVIRATTDDFQNPPEIRWKQGDNSPQGFYQDAIDLDAIEQELLFPLSQNGNSIYRTSTYDIHNLRPNYSAQKKASAGEILVFDGLFLQIPRLRDSWDVVIYIDASYDTCIFRAKDRNQEKKSSAEEIEDVYRNRYVPGFELYVSDVNPKKIADVIIKTE